MDSITFTTSPNVRFEGVPFTEWERVMRLQARAKTPSWEPAFDNADDANSGKLMNLIQSTLSSQHTALTSDCTSSKAMYDTLKEMYHANSAARTQELKVEFHSIKQQPGEPIPNYGARAKMLGADLTAAGVATSAEDIAMAFLNGLLPCYRTQQIIFLDTEPVPSLATMLPKLMRQESLNTSYSSSETTPMQAQAYFTAKHGNGGPSGYGQYGNSAPGHGHYNNGPSGSADSRQGPSSGASQPPLKCLYCHKAGHRIQDCRGRMRAEQRRTGNSDPGNDSTHHAGNTPKASSKKPIFW
uniref:CCHC-type domain-containing protein n=1 Tax=Tetradesmus obliquus TaxID=3088 RepID=A0A383W7J4_TETOB